MDKDRIGGSAKQLRGAAKQAIGKALGDAKMQDDGKVEAIKGKIQNAIGSLKDELREKK